MTDPRQIPEFDEKAVSDFETLQDVADYARSKESIDVVRFGYRQENKAVLRITGDALPGLVGQAMDNVNAQAVDLNGSIKWRIML